MSHGIESKNLGKCPIEKVWTFKVSGKFQFDSLIAFDSDL